ncbi:tol-pal system protein YbgF [Solidesulfovibrio sp.]
MMPVQLLLGVAALCLTGLLGACGPGNTLAVGKGSEDFRLKAVEANLQKVQDDMKTLSGRQQQTDARLGEVQQKVGQVIAVLESQGAKLPAAAPAGSALGVGFAHPGAAAAPEAGSGPAEPRASDGTTPPNGASLAGASGPAPSSPGTPKVSAWASGASPAGALPPPAAKPAAAADARGRRGLGRVGPAETAAPATPEAAIAADRGEAAAPRPAAAPVPPPSVQTPAATAPAPPPEPAVAPAPKSEEAAAAPAKPAVAGTPGYAETATPAQKAEYNKALQLAINGRTAEAKAAFDAFLAAHPASPLTPNALYWVGEGAFARGDYQTAVTDFDKVAKGWPGHHKAADSLYKMAMAQEKAGDVPAARATLERYLKDYPNAELAGVARQKLQALPK